MEGEKRLIPFFSVQVLVHPIILFKPKIPFFSCSPVLRVLHPVLKSQSPSSKTTSYDSMQRNQHTVMVQIPTCGLLIHYSRFQLPNHSFPSGNTHELNTAESMIMMQMNCLTPDDFTGMGMKGSMSIHS